MTATATPTKTAISVTIGKFDRRGGSPAYRPLREGQAIDEFEPLVPGDYRPAGGTPLLDATAEFIADLERQRAKGTVVIGALADESGSMMGNEKSVIDGINEFVGGMSDVEVDPEADGKVLAVILTDGLENASREVTSEQVADMITEREAEGWTFIYLGANQDSWKVGAGLRTTRSVNYASTPEGTSAALRNVGAQARSFVSSNALYARDASKYANASILEDGVELDQAGNVSEASWAGASS